MVKLGVHVSISGTIDQAFDRARELECESFQIFTRNPRGWKFRKLGVDEVKEFRRKSESYGLSPVLTHMPYLPNLSSPNKAIYTKSVRSLSAEFDRCSSLGIPYIVTHLGSHLGKGADLGLERLTAAINTAFSADHGEAMLLLENTAGTKNSMGSTFEEIKRIINGIDEKSRVGVCFDTAHAFAAGYDLRTPHGVDDTVSKFDAVLGIEVLKVVHLNDSKGPQGSGRDRHEHIGLGYIGENGFSALFRQHEIQNLPFILETPIDENGDELRDLRKAKELAA